MITGLKPRAETEMDRFAYDPYCRLYLPLWKLDGDSFMSKDAYGHLCSKGSAPYWTPQGWYFDGSDDYVNCGHDSSLDIVDAITVEAWVQPQKTDTQRIAAKQYSNEFTANCCFELGLKNTGEFRWAVGGVFDYSAGSYNKLVLYCFAATYNGSVAKIYVGGVEIDTHTVSGSIRTSTQDLCIGISKYNSSFYGPFKGLIPLVLIYSRALTPQEIPEHHIVGKELFG